MKRTVYVVLLALLSTSLFAQQRMVPLNLNKTMATADTTVTDATIDASEVFYWIGKGDHQLIMAVNWAAPDTALAWGFRFSAETITMDSVMKAITATDPRFSYETDTNGYIADIRFALNDAETLMLSQYSYWWMNLNGKSGAGLSQQLKDGDFAKWGDPAVAVVTDSMEYKGTYYPSEFAWTKKIQSVFTPEHDANILDKDILFWVGEGKNTVRFVVNWGVPDTALAWGYRFSSDEVLVDTVMAAIAAADPRFSYVINDSTGYLDDIRFVSGTDTFRVAPYSFWWMNLDGKSGAGLGQTLHYGSIVKWGDPVSGFVTGTMEYEGYLYPMGYVWTTAIVPVSAPSSIAIHSSMDVEIYPNPAKEYVQIRLSSAPRANMMLTDMQGRLLKSGAIGNEYRLDVKDLAAGMYLIRLQYGNSCTVQKIIVR